MLKKTLIKTLPLAPSVGAFGYMSACGCGHCPACIGSSAIVVGMAVYLSAKKLLEFAGNRLDKREEGIYDM